jgi:DNA polymerase-3 subunit gamma/tau
LIAHNLAEGLNQIQKSLDTGSDARQLARQMVDYLRNILLVKSGNSSLVDTTQEIRDTMLKQADMISLRKLLNSINQFNLAAGDSRSSSWQPGLALELAFTRSIQVDAQTSTEPVMSQPPTLVEKPIPAQKKKVASEPPAETAPVDQTKEKSPSLKEPMVEEKNDSPSESRSPAGGSEHQLIQQNWRKIIETVRKLSPGTQALVNSCHFNGIKQGCIRLAFASDLIKTKMESNDHLEITRKAIEQVTGLSMPIRCEVTDIRPADTASESQVNQESLVGSALRELGGQVVDVKEVNEDNKSEIN